MQVCKATDAQWKMGHGIQEWTKKNLWKAAFKNFEVIWSA